VADDGSDHPWMQGLLGSMTPAMNFLSMEAEARMVDGETVLVQNSPLEPLQILGASDFAPHWPHVLFNVR
jgi:hypothetical protein